MKRKRKQPRRLTPPLLLRDPDGGRELVAVDEELVTVRDLASSRAVVFLNLGPGLRVKVGSRCVNKRRVTSVTIRLATGPRPDPAPPAFQSLLEA